MIIDKYTGDPKWDRNEMWVPFRGNRMLSWPGYYGSQSKPDWKQVEPIKASLSYVDKEHGRSSVLFWVRDNSTALEYPLTFQDFMWVFERTTWSSGFSQDVLDYTFRKKGSNYFLVPEASLKENK
jgi:hypothetical protein